LPQLKRSIPLIIWGQKSGLSSSNDLLVAVVGNQIFASEDGGESFK
jgi:hypothetical protein